MLNIFKIPEMIFSSLSSIYFVYKLYNTHMTRVPNIANWGVFASWGMFMLVMVAAADSAKVQKKSTAFLYIAKLNHTLCTLYINRRVNCVFYSIHIFL